MSDTLPNMTSSDFADTSSQFSDYFKAVHGYEPYPWQSRLTEEVLEAGEWPEVIDLPTGTGKTAVLDTALYTLAKRPEIFPRRVVFVIDRRIVVDQVYKRAECIRNRIKEADSGVLADLRRRFKSLTDADEPLGVAALRGGVPIDGEWARRPEQPWVIVSTVDQFGSRLLFRGYGVSERMQPVHAGLAGNDCLVILDEVHLSKAFAQTLGEVSSSGLVPAIRSVNSDLLPRRFKIVEMSATPDNEKATRFKLQRGDLEGSPRLRRIARAPKHAQLLEIKGTRPAHESVPKKVVELICKKSKDPDINLRDDEMSVGVIVNRVRTARETCDALRANAAFRKQGAEVHLLTGRMRPIDRTRALEAITESVDPERPSPLAKRTVVVATQAIEVGADFSFDALITEAAPADSLRQRLGRLDRRGTLAKERSGAARCWILGVMSAMKPKQPDPVYGHSARVTWEELQRLAESGWEDAEYGDGLTALGDTEPGEGFLALEDSVESAAIPPWIDVGPGSSLFERLQGDIQAPKKEAPLVLPTHIDAWSQTNPKPVVDPPISEFLHGKESSHEPEVSILWRWDRSDLVLALVPPRPTEFLSVPISAAKGWLRGAAEVPVADTAAASADDQAGRRSRNRKPSDRMLRDVVIWTRSQEQLTEPLKNVDDLKPGSVLIAHPELGGLRNGTWDPGYRPTARRDAAGEDDGSEKPIPVEDVGDEAQLSHHIRGQGFAQSVGVRATLRLDKQLFKQLLSAANRLNTTGQSDSSDASGTSRGDAKGSKHGSSQQAFMFENDGTAEADGATDSPQAIWDDFPDPANEREASERPLEVITEWLSRLRSLTSEGSVRLPEWMARVVEEFSTSKQFKYELARPDSNSEHQSASGSEYYVLVGNMVDPAILDESDDAPSLTGTRTNLRDHLAGVGGRAAAYGRRLGLSESIIEDLRLAGELHDLGKVDKRFQAQLHGNDKVSMAGSDEPLAKSLPDARRPLKNGWPPVRHEISSVAMVQSSPALLEHAQDPDLVLHLIATHHGHGRSLFPIRQDDDPQQLQADGRFQDDGFRLLPANGEIGSSETQAGLLDSVFTTGNSASNGGVQGFGQAPGSVAMSVSSAVASTPLALEMANRFWRLQKRYGHHGLAWLEAILRLADHQQSAEEAKPRAEEAK